MGCAGRGSCQGIRFFRGAPGARHRCVPVVWVIGLAVMMAALSPVGVSEACDRITPCWIGPLPRAVGPRDRLYLLATGSCSERKVIFVLEEVDGPAGTHSLEITSSFLEVKSARYVGDGGCVDRKYIIVIDPIRDLRPSGTFRLTVVGERRFSVYLKDDDWPVVWKTGTGAFPLVAGGETEFTVTPEIDDSRNAPPEQPMLTGHTIGLAWKGDSSSYLEDYSVKLCMTSVPVAEASPERYLYGIQYLSADGEWTWIAAWRPSAPADRDPRCAYMVPIDARYPRMYSEPGILSFRPLMIRADGTYYYGNVRRISVEEAVNP